MRKWMAERLKRRKKPADKAPTESAPTPLQPAYFEAEPSAPTAEPDEPVAVSEPEASEAVEPQSFAAEPAVPTAGSQRAQSRGDSPSVRRRRRGGRGRGRSAGQGTPRESAPQPVGEPTAPVVPAAPRAPKGTVVLAIGLPGSGKSSWFKRNNITPLSTDLLRSLLFDDATEQRFQDLVFSNLRSMLKARLIARRPMNYVDATNLTPQERHGWVKLARDFGYEVQAVYFDVPAEVCLERNQKRERKVEEAILRRMADKLKAPTFDEGFTKITVVKVRKKENQPAKELNPE